MGRDVFFRLEVPPVIGTLDEGEIAARIEAFANAKGSQPEVVPLEPNLGSDTSSLLESPFPVLEAWKFPWNHETPAWKFADHAFGYLPLEDKTGNGIVSIVDPARVSPDNDLRGKAIDIKLDRLRVFQYPGGGQHNILFGFAAAHQAGDKPEGTQDLRFNKNYQVEEGAGSGTRGYPIFSGLRIPDGGVAFECTTVNISNVDDEKLLAAMNSDIFNKGLSLLSSINPVIPIASGLATGILKSLAARNENITVQHFLLGLDWNPGLTGAALREGSYIAVQTMDADAWKWLDWEFHTSNGAIVSKETGLSIPLNYVVFRVSKTERQA